MRRLGVILGMLGVLAAAMYFIEGPSEMNDFEIFHLTGVRFRHGEPLYRGTDGHFEFKYLPIAGALFALVSFVPIAIAKPLWLLVLVVAIGVAFERLWRAFPEVSPVAGGAVFLVLARCFEREFANGQVNGLLLLLVTLGFERISRGDDRWAGVLLSSAGLLKPHLFVFIPYLVLLQRPKAASSALVTLAAGLLTPALRYGSEGLLELHRNMNLRIAASTLRLLPDTANVSLPGVLTKLVHAPPLLATAGALLIVAPALYLPWKKARAERAEGIERPWEDLAVLMPALLLLAPQAWDFTVFTAAATLFVFVARRRSLPTVLGVAGVIACVVLALDMKLVFGRGATFEKVMHLSPNAWVLLVFLAIAIYVRLAPREAA